MKKINASACLLAADCSHYVMTGRKTCFTKGWLLVMVFCELLVAVYSNCPTDYYGEDCMIQCNCTSNVTSHACACESVNGLCDQLCMDGTIQVDRPGRHHVIATILGVVAAICIIGSSGLLLWHRHLWTVKGTKGPKMHRAPGAFKVPSCHDAASLTELQICPSELIGYDEMLEHPQEGPIHQPPIIVHKAKSTGKGVAAEKPATENRASDSQEENKSGKESSLIKVMSSIFTDEPAKKTASAEKADKLKPSK